MRPRVRHVGTDAGVHHAAPGVDDRPYRALDPPRRRPVAQAQDCPDHGESRSLGDRDRAQLAAPVWFMVWVVFNSC